LGRPYPVGVFAHELEVDHVLRLLRPG
jgi:hypothetical protein